MKKIKPMISIIISFVLTWSTLWAQEGQLIDFVDPMIGTTRDGNQIPGPRCPFGMVHPSPLNVGETRPQATSYRFGEPEMFGVVLTNLTGVGCPNFGSIVLKPTAGEISFESYKTKYSQEKAEVGFYSVMFDKDQIKTEITTTERCAIVRFHYPAGKANLLLDLSRREELDSSFMINVISPTEITGTKTDGRFCAAGEDILHRIYFVAQVNSPADGFGISKEKRISKDTKAVEGEEIGAFFSYDFKEKTELEVRVGISYVSIANARENLVNETEGKSFQKIKQECRNKWEKMLSRIEVQGNNKKHKQMFYTALYHTMSHPNILEDINGQYPGMGSGEIKTVEPGKHRFTVFSLWDTYRTLHPLFTLVYPEIQKQMAQSIMAIYDENGWLPQWELISKETHVMIGDPASIVLTDTYVKGIEFDEGDRILNAMINNAENHYLSPQWGYDDVAHIRRSIVPYLKNNGWVPYDVKAKGDRHWGTVATTQEYNLADYNIAQMAKQLGKEDIHSVYLERSKGYKNLYNPETGFFQQRWQNGEWVEHFDPFAGRWSPQAGSKAKFDMPWAYSGGPGYCEGMAWNYNFFVPHDMDGLIDLMGGEENFINRLQMLFDSNYYEPTNEPDIAFPFLFNYVAGQEWRTQKIVHHLIDQEFGTGTDGIPGNDDTGTMSSWLIFAMMGFYPDCPGNTEYQICTPTFDQIVIHLNQDYYQSNQFMISKKLSSSNDFKIKKMKLNGKIHEKYSIDHEDIVKGKSLEIEL